MATTPASDPAKSLSAWFGGLGTARSFSLGPLTCVPLVHDGPPPEPLLLLHDALAAGVLEIGEKDGGTVQELIAFNHGTLPVLVPQGETLVGAKQNRMVAHTVVIRPGRRVVLPVGCIEQGRWSDAGGSFQAGVGKSGWALRTESTREKLHRRREGQGPTLDQHRLWARVESELTSARVASASRDYCALLSEREHQVEELRRARPRLPNQVGVLVLHGGRFVGLEAFGSPGAWARMADRVLGSIATAGIGSRRESEPANPTTWLDQLKRAESVTRPGLDLGQDVELHGPGFFGEAVWAGSHPAHLCVFAA